MSAVMLVNQNKTAAIQSTRGVKALENKKKF
jgi:hypothetical protein